MTKTATTRVARRSRLRVLLTSAVLFGSTGGGGFGAPPAAARTADVGSERPNVVLIVADDQSFRDFGFLGNDRVHTPHIDRLASLSARYPNGYVPMSRCRASLATLLTGLYPHQHGIHFNHPPVPPSLAGRHRHLHDLTAEEYHAARARTDRFIREVPTIPRVLARHGYATLQTGKFWEGHYSNAGFTEGMTTGRPSARRDWLTGTRQQRNGEWVAHGNGDAGLVIGRETMEPVFRFIDEHVSMNARKAARAGRRPFFVWYAPFLPHDPFDAPAEYRDLALQRGAPPHLVGYYASIARFDATVGDLLGFLAERNLLASTLIVFVADNGYRPDAARPPVPDDRSKSSQYEDGLRTPILIRWDGRIVPGEHPAPVETVDVLPTVLSAAGLSHEVTPKMRGRNLLPSATGLEELPLIPVFGAIYPNSAFTLGRPGHHVRARWVRYGHLKLVLHTHRAPGLPMQELYDLGQDPRESTNLADSPAGYAEWVVGWLADVIDWWWRPEVL